MLGVSSGGATEMAVIAKKIASCIYLLVNSLIHIDQNTERPREYIKKAYC
jgi:hypothetical protein